MVIRSISCEDMIRLAFSPDARVLASESYDETVKLWGVPANRIVWTIPPNRWERLRKLIKFDFT